MLRDERVDRNTLAEIVAGDIEPGSFVNLGIGQPTLVSNYLTAEHDVTLHTENGMLGMGRAAEEDEIDAGSDQRRQNPGHRNPWRGVLPPGRLICDHARRPPGCLCAGGIPGFSNR